MKYITGFDYLRSIAAFSVVWIHSCYTNPVISDINIVNSYAVPAFIIMSIFLLGKKIESKEGSLSVAKRFLLRILPQYIFWTILYLALRFIKLRMSNEPIEITFSSIFLGGSAVQLWFLPAIAIWYSMMSFIYKYKNILIDVVIAIILFFCGRYLLINGYLEPGFQNCFALYSGYIFIAKIIYQYFSWFRNVSVIYYFSIIVLSLFFSIWLGFYIFDVVYAITIFLLFATLNIKSNQAIGVISRYSFGIYLSHFVFIQIIVLGENMLGLDNSGIIVTLLNILMTFFLSLSLCYLLDKNRFTRKII